MTITERIDRHTHMEDGDFREDPPIPRSVKIELMRSCNYKCGFCANPQLDDRTGKMDWALYERTLADLKSAGVKEVAPFFYGESFMHPNLAYAVRLAKAAGFERVFLTTNGSLATPARVETCIRAGLDSLKFSINFATPEQFAEIARAPVRFFRQAIENVKAAREVRDRVEAETGHRCELSISSIEYTGEQAAQMDAVLEELRPFVDTTYFLPVYNTAATVVRDGWTFGGGNTGRAGAPVPPVPCWVLFKSGHVTYTGESYACCFVVGDQFNVGNLRDQSFAETWHSEKFRALRRAHLNMDVRGTPCEGCIKQGRA